MLDITTGNTARLERHLNKFNWKIGAVIDKTLKQSIKYDVFKSQ